MTGFYSFLNQSILNFILKYTPLKTNMNVSQNIAPWDWFLPLCVEFHSSDQNSQWKRDFYCGCGQSEFKGKRFKHTHFSFIPKVPVRAEMPRVLHIATVQQAGIQCEWYYYKVKKGGAGVWEGRTFCIKSFKTPKKNKL